MSQKITLPQWIARENNITRDVVVEGVVKETARAMVLKMRPVYSAGANHCHRCYRELTHPVSRLVGFGPECCAQMGIPRPPDEYAENWIQEAEKVLGDITYELQIPKSTLTKAGFEFTEGVTPKVEDKPQMQAIFVNGKIKVIFGGYYPELIDELKAEIDYKLRSYERETRAWVVDPDAGTDLLRYLVKHNFKMDEGIPELLGLVEVDDSPKRTITYNGKSFDVRFPYEYHLKEAVKSLPARFSKTNDDPRWVVNSNPQTMKGLRLLIEAEGFVADDASISLLFDPEEEKRREEMYNLSSASDTDFRCDIEALKPFQHVAVEYISKAKSVIVGDTMGLGKTLESLAAVEHNNLFPVLVISPASLKLNWKKEVFQWCPNRSVEVLNGRENANYDADIVIINYDILSDGWNSDAALKDAQEEKKRLKKANQSTLEIDERIKTLQGELRLDKKFGVIAPSTHTQELAKRDFKAVIMDEGHYIKEGKAQRSRGAQYLAAGSPGGRAAGYLAKREGVEYRIWLSGTPVLNRPSELIFPLTVLGRLDELGGFNEFTYNYCARNDGPWGMNITGASNTDELNRLMRESFYIRRTKKDVLDQLPPKEFANANVKIDNREEYDFAEKELLDYVGHRAINDPEFLEMIADLPDDEADVETEVARFTAANKAEAAETLVLLSNLRRLTAEGKLQSSIRWIEDFLQNGESLIVFANHRKIVNAIAEHFNAPKIMGGMKAEVIEKGKEDFQNKDEQLIVLNIQAGGIGHTLTAAHHVAFVEFPWNPGQMDQAIDRAYARMNDLHGVTVWQVIAESTMDEIMLGMIDSKRKVVDSVTEGTGEVKAGSLLK